MKAYNLLKQNISMEFNICVKYLHTITEASNFPHTNIFLKQTIFNIQMEIIQVCLTYSDALECSAAIIFYLP